MSTKILLLQQNEGVRRARSLVFGGAYFHSLQLENQTAVEDYLAHENVDVILNDCRGAEAKGLEWVETLRKEHAKTKVVLVTEAMDLPMVIKSIRLGVKDVFAGPLDLKAISRSLGDIAGAKEHEGDALRKADWSTFADFFGGKGDDAPKAAPPSSGRRTAGRIQESNTSDPDSLQSDRKQLAEDSRKLKEQLDELEKRRSEVTKAEQRLKERENQGTRPPANPEESALRRERESLRMQVMELESERDLLQKNLAEKEAALAAANSTLALMKAGQSAAASIVTTAPFAAPPPPPPAPSSAAPSGPSLAELQEAQQALRSANDRLAQAEQQASAAQAEGLRWREQLAQCERERDQARDFLSAKEKALANATTTLQRLQSEVGDYERRLRDAQHAQSAGQAAGQTARAEREQTVAQLASLEAERDFLKGQIEAMESDLAATRDTVDRLQREAAEFSSRLDEANRLAQGGDEALRQERENLLARVARLESERNLAREHLSGKEKSLAEANVNVQKLRHELVQLTQRARERENAQRPQNANEGLLQRDLMAAQERLGLVELERDNARDQLVAKEAALEIANATVDSLRGEVEHYLARLQAMPVTSSGPVIQDEALKAERDQLRTRLSKAERERDHARDLLQAKERALQEASEALRRLRLDGDLTSARSREEIALREKEMAEAEQRLLRTQTDVQAAQEKMDEAWSRLQAEQEKISARKRELEEQSVALANRERLLQLERAKAVSSTGAEEVGASERRLRLLRTEMASLAAALNEREAALRTQEIRVEQLLGRADADLRNVAAKESLLQSRADEIEQRIAVAEARAAEIIAVAQARADAEERANAGLSEALRREREAVRKAEARYLAACHEVGEQLQAMAEREALMRKREFQLDERENSIRHVLQRVLADANALARGDAPLHVFDPAASQESPSNGSSLNACDEARQVIEEQRRTFREKAKRIGELSAEVDQDPVRKF